MNEEKKIRNNSQLLLAYSAPYFAYVFIASVFDKLVSVEISYLLRITVVTGLLLWFKKWYFSLSGPKRPIVSIIAGICTGFLGTFIWILLINPFTQGQSDQTAWSDSAFFLRLLSAGLLVPLLEEILMRGFLFRFALQWDKARKNREKEPLQTTLDHRSVNEVTPGEWSWMAIIVSTLAFTSGHHMQEWPAAIAYGVLMAWLYIIRKDLLSCIVAHAVTNISLALYILNTGKWYLW